MEFQSASNGGRRPPKAARQAILSHLLRYGPSVDRSSRSPAELKVIDTLRRNNKEYRQFWPEDAAAANSSAMVAEIPVLATLRSGSRALDSPSWRMSRSSSSTTLVSLSDDPTASKANSSMGHSKYIPHYMARHGSHGRSYDADDSSQYSSSTQARTVYARPDKSQRAYALGHKGAAYAVKRSKRPMTLDEQDQEAIDLCDAEAAMHAAELAQVEGPVDLLIDFSDEPQSDKVTSYSPPDKMPEEKYEETNGQQNEYAPCRQSFAAQHSLLDDHYEDQVHDGVLSVESPHTGDLLLSEDEVSESDAASSTTSTSPLSQPADEPEVVSKPACHVTQSGAESPRVVLPPISPLGGELKLSLSPARVACVVGNAGNVAQPQSESHEKPRSTSDKGSFGNRQTSKFAVHDVLDKIVHSHFANTTGFPDSIVRRWLDGRGRFSISRSSVLGLLIGSEYSAALMISLVQTEFPEHGDGTFEAIAAVNELMNVEEASFDMAYRCLEKHLFLLPGRDRFVTIASVEDNRWFVMTIERSSGRIEIGDFWTDRPAEQVASVQHRAIRLLERMPTMRSAFREWTCSWLSGRIYSSASAEDIGVLTFQNLIDLTRREELIESYDANKLRLQHVLRLKETLDGDTSINVEHHKNVVTTHAESETCPGTAPVILNDSHPVCEPIHHSRDEYYEVDIPTVATNEW